jgi:hypothetical protein
VSKLFQYAVVHRPKEGDAEVLVYPQTILAKDEATVRIHAARDIDEDFEGLLNDVEILVRPFA